MSKSRGKGNEGVDGSRESYLFITRRVRLMTDNKLSQVTWSRKASRDALATCIVLALALKTTPMLCSLLTTTATAFPSTTMLLLCFDTV